MSYIFATVGHTARRWAWLTLLPAMTVCAADASTGTLVTPPPDAISDLAVANTSETSVTLAFTQVENGSGQPANYDVRFAASPISWSSATSATNGSCATPLTGTGVGTSLSCTVLGLSPSTTYDFQVVAFRGSLSSKAVFGGLSNVVAASTGGPPPAPVVTTVSVSPPAAAIAVGANTTLAATVNDQNGNVMTGQTVNWSSSNASVAPVSSSGVVSGLAAGSATITAAVSGKSGTASITVTAGPPPPPVPTTVSITPASASVATGSTVTLQATVNDQYGSPMSGQTIAWSSSDPAAATVNSSGIVTGVAVGSATITATSSGKSGTAAITVTAVAPVVTTVTVAPASASVVAGSTVNLQATVRDQNGNVMAGQSITWSTSTPAAATVNSSGVVTGVAAGSATITATSSGRSGTSAITVTAAPPVVTTVTVAPASASVLAGSTVNLQATVRDQYGAVMAGQSIIWSTGNAAAATVNSSGVVTGVAAGSATITATVSGKSGTAAITVTAPPVVTTITVAPVSASVMTGSTVSLQATVRDQYGAVMTGQTVTWSSNNLLAATVNSSGVVTGVAIGSATITATASSISGTSTVTVSAPLPPGGIVDPTLLPRATGQLPLAGTYGRGLAAGQTYTDPLTGVLVLKLTSSSVPNANGGVYHGYSEGGPVISQPWLGTDGNTYYTAYLSHGWLVDIRYDTFAPSNWRTVPIDGEINFAFSLNPATPRIGYYVDDGNDKTIHRYNTATNRNENTGIFPYTTSAVGGALSWLQVNLNDGWLVGMLNSNATVIGVRISDGLERIIPRGANDVDEPHIDREFPIVYISTNNEANIVVNLETGAIIPETDPQNIDAADHEAPLRGKVVYINYTVNGIVSTSRTGNVQIEVQPSPTDWSGDWHMAGQWVFNNPSEYFIMDQFARNGNYPIRQGMIGFVSIGDDVRILVATDATGTGYDTGGQVHPTLAPDGKLVMWTSNMNGSGRFDVFVARVPTR
jgi:uncharacterized protein YjdB